MSGREKKPVFRDYENGLRSLLKESLPQIVFIYGPSEFLRESARRRLEDEFKKKNIPVVGIEATTLQTEAFRELWEQTTLFDPKTAYTLKRCEQNKQFSKLLDNVPKKSAISCHFVMVSGVDKLLVGMSKSLARLEAITLPCFEPWPSDMPALVQRMATKKTLALQQDAVCSLIEAVGTDLSKLDNELDKLKLLGFADRPLTSTDVRPFLGLIREDHVFKLDQHLTDGNFSHAHALCSDLLARGEKGLQILWIFSNHCRKALQAHELRNSGVSARDMGFKLRLPPALAKSYATLVNRTPPERFQSVLSKCQQADIAFKTSRASEELVLSQLVESLAGRI